MKDFVVYTAVVGPYDDFIQPQVVDERFDYVLFSNEIDEHNIGVWKVMHFQYENSIQTKVARWVKTHPEELLPEYKASLWMDANIQIATSWIYDRFIELYQTGILVSSIKHPTMDCAYDEMFYMILGHYEYEDVILKWGKELRRAHFPRHFGLAETGITYRKNDPVVRKIDKLWWNSIDHFSRRDQISFTYSLWKYGLSFIPFLPEGENVRQTDYVHYISHKNVKGKYLMWNHWEAWLCRYSERNPREEGKIKEIYYHIFGYPSPKIMSFVLGQCYRLKSICRSRFNRNKC